MTLHQTLVNFTVSSPGYWRTGCLWWEAVKSWFHLDLKLFFFALKNQFHGVLTWSHYWMDKYDIWVADEMDMTPLQVRYSWGKFLPQTLSGTPLTIIYTRCSSWHEGLGCHASMTTSNKYISFLTTDLWNVEICCWFILIEYGHA